VSGLDIEKFISLSIFLNELCLQANDGSPLVYRDSDNTWSLLGLLSFRSDVGCNSGHPLGFMRTTSVLAWISDKTSIAVRN
jgi:hypothetical protein